MGKKSSSSTTKPWKEAQPYILGAAKDLQGAYGANSGKIQGYTDSVTGLLPGMIEEYKAGDSGVNAARDYNVDVLGGKYLDQGNPYLDEMIARSNGDIRNQTQAALGARGLTGGSDYAGLIADRVAKNTLGMRYSDYGAERDRMATAAGQSPSLAAADILRVAPMLSTLESSLTPLQAAGGYAGAIGGLLGQYTKTKQKNSVIGNILQAGSNAAAAFAGGG